MKSRRYYSQHHERLDLKLTAEEQLLMVIGKDRRADARQMLARFLLIGEDVERPIATLSGGQRARVAMCLLLLDETNLLVLDEPTNYLDIPAKHAVEEALRNTTVPSSYSPKSGTSWTPCARR